MEYPLYYIVKSTMAQPTLDKILAKLAEQRQFIEQIRDTKNEKSRKIELALKGPLKELGFLHSVTNRIYPLFGPESQFEVDFYCPKDRIAIEVERSNLYTKVWLALFKMLESNHIEHALIMVPIQRVVRNSPENSYELTYKRIRDNAINLLGRLETLVIVGY